MYSIAVNTKLLFLGPTFKPSNPILQENLDKFCQQQSTSAQNTTRQVLSELESAYQNHYGMSFTDSLTKMPGSRHSKKTTKRKIQRECRDHISSQMQKTDAMTVLAEGPIDLII